MPLLCDSCQSEIPPDDTEAAVSLRHFVLCERCRVIEWELMERLDNIIGAEMEERDVQNQ